MNDAELDAAGISDPGLRRDYLITGRVLARHGRGLERIRYMFPTPKRPYMDALWTFIGYLDDLADEPSQSAEIRLLRLAEWQRAFERHRNDEPARDRTNLSTGEVDDEATARAFVHMMRTWNLPLERVSDYIDAQRRAIHTTEYRTYEDLLDYVENITLLPSLWMNTLYETSSPESEALCRQAVTAFKLMDFIWDVPEDLETGHLYLPLEDLEQFGLDRARLTHEITTGTPSRALRDLMRFQIERARRHLDAGRDWAQTVHPTSRAFLDFNIRRNYRLIGELEKDDLRLAVGAQRKAPALAVATIADILVAIAKAWLINQRATRAGYRLPVSPAAETVLQH